MPTAIPGFLVGHASDHEALTGFTVIITPEGSTCGVDVRGSAPGTRETDLLDPMSLVDKVHAVLLAGGSAFGLDAAAGVMRWLEERGHGFESGVARVLIVPAAVLFDLGLGRADRRPDAAMGYAACEDAARRAGGGEPLAEGNVGATCLEGPGGLLVGAIVAVNAFGDVRDPATGRILAGTRNPAGGWVDTAAVMTGQPAAGGGDGSAGRGSGGSGQAGQNTTIGVVATNAPLTKAQARKAAQMAHDGLALAISPVHTMFDDDTLFAVSCSAPGVAADVTVVGTLAVRAVAMAVVRAALEACAAGGLPGAGDPTK